MAPRLEIAPIHALISRVQRRLKIQSALEYAATAVIAASAAALITIYLLRVSLLSQSTGLTVLLWCFLLIPSAAIVGYARRRSDVLVATRIDRACDLASRISSAYELDGMYKADPTAAALTDLAVEDGVRTVPRADARAASPFLMPADGRVAIAFLVVSVAVAGLHFATDETGTRERDGSASKQRERAPRVTLDPKAVEFAKRHVARLRRHANKHRLIALRGFADTMSHALSLAPGQRAAKNKLLATYRDAVARLDRAKLDVIAVDDMDDLGTIITSIPLPPPPPPGPPTLPPGPKPVPPGATLPTPTPVAPNFAGLKPGRTDGPPPLGPAKRTRQAMDNKLLKGRQGRTGRVRRDVILATAKRGTSQRGYKTVYAEYSTIMPKVLRRQAVPSGYRVLVKKYFDAIRPADSR